MKTTTKNLATVALGAALAFTLTACTGSTAAQHVPSATDAPAATAPAPATPSAGATTAPTPTSTSVNAEWGIDLAGVDTQSVADAYGADAAKTVVGDALTTLHIATVEAADLHVARDAAGEAGRYEILRDRVTDQGWGYLAEAAAKPEADTTGLGLAPHAPLSGAVDGHKITAISAALVSQPKVTVAPGTTAAGQHAVVTVTERVTVTLDGVAPMVVDRTIGLYLVPNGSGSGWLLDSWAWTDAPAGK